MGVLSALTASLCCIAPVLALLAGTSSIASTFSWVEPLRPFLIGATALLIAFAWYQKLRPQVQKEIDCQCEEGEKPPFIQSNTFLGMLTLFAGLMLAFPYYSHAFYSQSDTQASASFQEKPTQKLVLDIKGMTCAGCEAHVEQAANKVEGIQKAKASYAEGKAEIEFDPTRTNPEKIMDAVKTTGYKITASKVSSTKKSK